MASGPRAAGQQGEAGRAVCEPQSKAGPTLRDGKARQGGLCVPQSEAGRAHLRAHKRRFGSLATPGRLGAVPQLKQAGASPPWHVQAESR